MPKRKSKFTEEFQQKYPFFRKGRDECEAECINCGYETFVSVTNKGKLSLDMHVDNSIKKLSDLHFLFIGITNYKIICCICTNYQNIIIKSGQRPTNVQKIFPALQNNLLD